MKLKYILLVIVAAIVGLGVWSALSHTPPTSNTQTGTGELSDLIRVDTPVPNAVVGSPLTVSGQARGSWYFEASFPVRLLDASGTVLYAGPMQAQGDWMTSEFVPFKGTITFAPPKTETGTLVFQKDNPSGLPENEKELRIPVRFAKAAYQSVNFSTSVTLRTGEWVRFSDGLTVGLKEINDSRCQPNVQCIWAGELSALLLVGEANDEVRLGATTSPTQTYKNYTFTLKSATETTATITVTKNITNTPMGELRGYVHVGPTCPVMQNPPDPQCDDRPYAVTIEIHYPNEKLQGTVKSGADGHFAVTLSPGTYIVRPQSADVLPRCPEQQVTVTANSTTNVDISCDSGIR